MVMKAGVFLPHIGVADRDLLRGFAQRAEALGFDSVWAGDHVVLPRSPKARYPYSEDGRYGITPSSPFLELWTTLSFLAGVTERLRLGAGVCILPYRHPVLTAKMVATLDFLSAGRVEFGVGVGWLAEEFDALGADYGARGLIVDEQLHVIEALWTQEVVSFQGRFYHLKDVGFAPKPVQRPHPRIWVGGNADAARRRAARAGDFWFPAFFRNSLEEIAAWRGRLREDCRAAGRSPDAVGLAGRINVDLREAPDLERARKRDILVGAPEKLAEGVAGYLRAGVDYPIFMLPPAPPGEFLASLERLGSRVLPLLR